MLTFFPSANEKVVLKKTVEEAVTVPKEDTVAESFSKMTVNDVVDKRRDEKEALRVEILDFLKANSISASDGTKLPSTVEVLNYEELDVVDKSKGIRHESNEKVEEDFLTEDDEEEDVLDENEDEEEIVLSEESEELDEEYFYGENDTDEDLLLEEDMLVMEDYLENIELEEGEDLNDLLAWSAMQNGNLEIEVESDYDEENIKYDYADLDKRSHERTVNDFEEDSQAILIKKNKSSYVNESTKKKVSHLTKDDNAIVDPEIFGQTLKAALADCPPGLRPGMRRWYEKQQRKEDRKKKKEEAKAHRREKKKNGKGKEKEENDEDFTNQMAKIDE